MIRRRLRATLVIAIGLAASVTACTSTTPAGRTAKPASATSSSARVGGGALAGSASVLPTSGATASSTQPVPATTPAAATTTARPTTAAPAVVQLPQGGTRLFPNYRVVAFYGAPHNSGLGILGASTPEHAALAIEATARAYANYGRPVQPAMELIATVAQGSAGPDGDYSSAVSSDEIAEYLAVAKRHRMLLVLDFQPGRGEFLPQVKQYEKFLLDPWVGVALDPEWKVGPTQLPARVIGSASAASINVVSAYLADLVAAHRLPQKLFIVHEFTSTMLPDRDAIVTRPQLASALHADGHGSIAVKQNVYAGLDFPTRFGAGFKLFFREDPQLMTPAQVMALPRRPDLVTYQ